MSNYQELEALLAHETKLAALATSRKASSTYLYDRLLQAIEHMRTSQLYARSAPIEYKHKGTLFSLQLQRRMDYLVCSLYSVLDSGDLRQVCYYNVHNKSTLLEAARDLSNNILGECSRNAVSVGYGKYS
jgi:hypothetical protein